MANKRPVLTVYNGGERTGKSTTPARAVKAAFRRLVDGDFRHAEIRCGRRIVAEVFHMTPGRQDIQMLVRAPRMLLEK